jgi:hypothetical protein
MIAPARILGVRSFSEAGNESPETNPPPDLQAVAVAVDLGHRPGLKWPVFYDFSNFIILRQIPFPKSFNRT